MGWLISPSFGALLEEPARAGRHRDFAREALDLLDGRLAVDEGPAHDLTERELDVLRQVAWGASNADIASTLFITENTVKTHLASIFRKLSVDRRSAAARVAREQHLL
jgi:DNA-binding NarL/FixJ family response regulator